MHLLDITAKSGHPEFAPYYEDVMKFKHHEMTWDEYEAIYLQRMRQSRRDSPEEWEKLKELPESVAVVCYCRPEEHHCHRHLFKHLLSDYLKDHHIEVDFGGELTGYIVEQLKSTKEQTKLLQTDTRVTESPHHVPHP